MKKSLRFLLKEKLQPQALSGLIQSYDIIGDIAVIRVPETFKSQSPIVAEAIMQTHKHVKRFFGNREAFQANSGCVNLNGLQVKRRPRPYTGSLGAFLRLI